MSRRLVLRESAEVAATRGHPGLMAALTEAAVLCSEIRSVEELPALQIAPYAQTNESPEESVKSGASITSTNQAEKEFSGRQELMQSSVLCV